MSERFEKIYTIRQISKNQNKRFAVNLWAENETDNIQDTMTVNLPETVAVNLRLNDKFRLTLVEPTDER